MWKGRRYVGDVNAKYQITYAYYTIIRGVEGLELASPDLVRAIEAFTGENPHCVGVGNIPLHYQPPHLRAILK
jgi:hypothetical protein